MDFHPSLMERRVKAAIFIPTNLPANDPRDISSRARARFEVAMNLARELRKERGRANVLVVVMGGWPLHGRLPLAVHHVYAASRINNMLELDELDLVASHGINTVTDLHNTLEWMKGNLVDIQEAYVVTSRGHAARLVAESSMHSVFERVHHVESNEERSDEQEDELWVSRSLDFPAHQHLYAARAAEVSRFGTLDSFECLQLTREWAEKHPREFRIYMNDVWQMLQDLEENNVAVRSLTPGAWRIDINC